MQTQAAAGATLRGVVKMFRESGYGFIRAADGGEIFVHVKDCQGRQALAAGQRVEYRIGTSPRDGRDRAIDVRVIED